MISAFQNYLRSETNLSEEDISLISTLAIPIKLKRNDFVLREGDVCRHKTFVVTGMLRTTAIIADGSEHILQFSPEESWTLDVESYDKKLPSLYSISAIEPSEVLLWTKADFDRLLAELSGLQGLSAKLISSNIYSARQRLVSTLSATPEEKYEDFVQGNPGLLSRLPLWMIASYLGISLKTLTRIRHAQLQR